MQIIHTLDEMKYAHKDPFQTKLSVKMISFSIESPMLKFGCYTMVKGPWRVLNQAFTFHFASLFQSPM